MKFIFEQFVFVLSFQTLITNALTVKIKQLTYLVGLDAKFKDHTNLCGGALISKEHILTAAHCIYNAESIKVMFGLRNFQEDDKVETIHVDNSSIILHENFVRENFENNNIAIVKLPFPVTESDYIKILNLPNEDEMKKSFEKELTMFAGWDLIKDDKMMKRRSKMKVVIRRVLDADSCKQIYPNFNTEVNICFRGSRKRGCIGDSGSPLVFSDGYKRTIIGVATFVGEKCLKGFPIEFTRVTSYMDWISSKIN